MVVSRGPGGGPCSGWVPGVPAWVPWTEVRRRYLGLGSGRLAVPEDTGSLWARGVWGPGLGPGGSLG